MPAIVILVGSVFWNQVESLPRADLERTVARLMRQLDDDRLDRRQEAEEALIQLGSDALTLLPSPAAQASAELKERLARVRGTLERKSARQAIDPGRVTLSGKLSLAEVFGAIQQQTGNAFESYDLIKGEVEVDFQQALFWEAVDRVLDQARLTIDPLAGRGDALVIVPRTPWQTDRVEAACYRGLFRLEPTLVTAVRDLRSPRLAGARVRVAIAWEPRITPIAITAPLSVLQARDDRDRPIPVDGPARTLSVAVEGSVSVIELELPLALPPRDARRIESLAGTLQVLLPAGVETFAFSDLRDAVDRRQRGAGVTVTLERIRQSADVHEVHVRVRFDEAGEALESHRGWIFKNDAYLVDASGTRVSHTAQRVVSQDPDGVGIVYRFVLDQPVSNYTFRYRTPTLLVHEPISFELRRIELP